ncbi:hypothetical protein O6H91_04G080200 [Diphasiastrum complanatum]|uniref:Uncharacterized protein n=1 Tax=Diphasiastrum complanatum TaxID=34168 RepID=A0ACC2DZA7_DIPCM|nr:hypothetical protein O6H91_04G080200 [Diphasiastrum complanatum]
MGVLERNPLTLQKLSLSAGLLFSILIAAQGFDFFYFVQQWPGSFCDISSSCCYPVTGKPAPDFSIHGFWPNNNDGTYPFNCDLANAFNASKISDLNGGLTTHWPSLACPSSNGESFWQHEWLKHGTCSESILDEHAYFKAVLSLRGSIDILGALQKARIQPNNGMYSFTSINNALTNYLAHTPGIECNSAANGQNQLYQIYVCVATDATTLIDCPILPQSHCSSQLLFPSF